MNFTVSNRRPRTTNRPLLSQWVSITMVLLLSPICGSYVQPDSHEVPRIAETDIPADAIKHRLILFGDGGEPDIDKSNRTLIDDWTLKTLSWRAGRIPDKTTIVFLGDNIYPKGLEGEEDDKKYKKARKKLDAQIAAVVKSDAAAIFVPGNHDWQRAGKKGWEVVKAQEAYINQRKYRDNLDPNDPDSTFFANIDDVAAAKITFLPKGGHPGPEKVDKNGICIIVLDTQWWLHKHDKPLKNDESEAKKGVIKQLIDTIGNAGTNEVVVVAHHPLVTHGPHGGFFDWKDHIFPARNLAKFLWIPLPGVGSLYPLARRHIGLFGRHEQDVYNSRNREMIKALRGALKEHPPLIYAAGHEHSLQVLEDDEAAQHLLVSGSGSKTSKVSRGSDTLYAHQHEGFMEVTFMQDGSVLLGVVETKKGTEVGNVAFSEWLRKAR